jgi:hypothetical protein
VGRQVEFFAAALGLRPVAYHLVQSLAAAGVPSEAIGQIATAITPLAGDIVSSGLS